jgi:hypothetical protein
MRSALAPQRPRVALKPHHMTLQGSAWPIATCHWARRGVQRTSAVGGATRNYVVSDGAAVPPANSYVAADTTTNTTTSSSSSSRSDINGATCRSATRRGTLLLSAAAAAALAAAPPLLAPRPAAAGQLVDEAVSQDVFEAASPSVRRCYA